MCFHTSTINKVKRLEKHFNVKISDSKLEPYFDKPTYHHNGFSHPNMLVIPQAKSEYLAPAVWGIVPSNKTSDEIKPYFKESVRFGGGLNARSEKVFDHFVYRDSIMDKRCIIPVSGFFEPHDFKKKKYPYYFKHVDDMPLALAGIYTVIDTYITFTILTKIATPLFEKVHNLKKRQPIILSVKDSKLWLDNNIDTNQISELLQCEYLESNLETYPVSKELFSPKIDSNKEEIIKKVNYPELNQGSLF